MRGLIALAQDFRGRGIYAEGEAVLNAAPAALDALLARIEELCAELRISYPMTPVDCLLSELGDEFHHDGRDGRYIMTRERFLDRVAEFRAELTAETDG